MEWLNDISALNKLYLGLLVANFVIISVNYRRLPDNLRPLLALVISNLLVETYSDYIKVTTDGNNLFLYHFYAPVEYCCIMAIFYRTLEPVKYGKRIIYSVAGYITTVVISTLLWQPLTHNNSITYMAESALIIYWCFMFFKAVLDRNELYIPERDSTFWVLVAILIYFTGTFFTIGLIDHFIITDKKLATIVYYASFPFNYILYATIGVICLMPSWLSTYE